MFMLPWDTQFYGGLSLHFISTNTNRDIRMYMKEKESSGQQFGFITTNFIKLIKAHLLCEALQQNDHVVLTLRQRRLRICACGSHIPRQASGSGPGGQGTCCVFCKVMHLRWMRSRGKADRTKPCPFPQIRVLASRTNQSKAESSFFLSYQIAASQGLLPTLSTKTCSLAARPRHPPLPVIPEMCSSTDCSVLGALV